VGGEGEGGGGGGGDGGKEEGRKERRNHNGPLMYMYVSTLTVMSSTHSK